MQTTAPFNSNKSYEVITMDKANEELIKSELEGMILNEDTLKLLSFPKLWNPIELLLELSLFQCIVLWFL